MAEAKPKITPPVTEAGPECAGKTCSICQTTIVGGEKVVACPYCALPFHSECWTENRGCSAYGCEGVAPTPKAQIDTQPVSNAWSDEKPCPSCGKTIKAQALKCRFCGASFDTRDVISQDEYSRRDYEGTEYNAARNKVVGLFILSAAACLAPLGLLLCALLVKQKEFMGLDYKRLPPALKAVVWSAMGISSFLILIMILIAAFD